MTELHYIAIGLGIALLLFLLWKENTRTNKGRVAWRLIASILMIAALLCMILPLHYNGSEQSANDTVIVVTPNPDIDSIDAFSRSTGTKPPVYVSSNTITEARRYEPQLLSSMIAGTVHVFGEGLPGELLRTWDTRKIVFHPSPLNGITAIHWNRQLMTGEKLVVTGKYVNNTGKAAGITISSFNTTLDSVVIPAHTARSFELSFVPKQVGRLVCQLAVTARKDTLEKSPVPFQVLETKAPSVILLAAAPDFEDRFLRSWLAEKGYPVVTRTGVSKNKFSQAYLNTNSINTTQLSGALLDQADLIIADARSMAALSANERGMVQQYISQKRKGLVIRTDSAHGSFPATLFSFQSGDSAHRQESRLYLNDTSLRLAPLNLSNTPTLRLREGNRPLLTANGKVYAASTLYGAGRIVATTLSNSFSWALSGNRQAYDELWSAIIGEAIARDAAPASWKVEPALPAVNEPVTIILQSNQSTLPQAAINGSTVVLSQDINFPTQWTGTYWPTTAGWQTGIGLNGEPWYWYAYDTKDWRNARMATREAEMIMLLKTAEPEKTTGQLNHKPQTTNHKPSPVPFPKLWFLILFLLAVSYLWFENKYYNR